MAAYTVFETGHTFGPSMLYPVYRSVEWTASKSTRLSRELINSVLILVILTNFIV